MLIVDLLVGVGVYYLILGGLFVMFGWYLALSGFNLLVVCLFVFWFGAVWGGLIRCLSLLLLFFACGAVVKCCYLN